MDQTGPKDSRVTLHEVDPVGARALRNVLSSALGAAVVVDERRHNLRIGIVKFHVDFVEGLGSFCEIEAIDRTGEIGREALLEQCERYIGLLGIDSTDLQSRSYSDLLGPTT